MTIEYLKTAQLASSAGQDDVRESVQRMLAEIERDGDAAALRYARELDRWEGGIVVDAATIDAAAGEVPMRLQDDIRFAHANVRRFAEAQKESAGDCRLEILPGLVAGQKRIPIGSVGCYVPGGRYNHIASAIMTVTTAKVAGVEHITVCSPPRAGEGIAPAVLFTLKLCGAERILNLGGVQGVAALAYGLFDTPAADLIAGPGNQYVAEAKRILYGQVGIDMFAGPTNLLILADASADPAFVAADLVGQAEHGYNSPVWLATTDRELAEAVMARVPALIAKLPVLNRDNAEAAWRDYAEVIVCADREQLASLADRYAPEHLHVQAQDLDWWLERLRAYGSLFLGEETTVAFGDKSAGPNHVLPTSGAARYTGGLSVQTFMKTVTWQRFSREAVRPIAEATARISRFEGMEGHARTADIRLGKFFPEERFELAADQ